MNTFKQENDTYKPQGQKRQLKVKSVWYNEDDDFCVIEKFGDITNEPRKRIENFSNSKEYEILMELFK